LEVEASVLITPAELELHKVVVSKEYAAGEIDYHGAEFQQRGTLAVRAVAELTGEGIRIRGHLETRLEARCDRCLAPVEFPVRRDFDLSYRPLASIARVEEIEVSEDELAVGFYSGEGIALADLLSEQVILSVPMKIVCRAECRGLCPVCGADRNREECHCPSPSSESPFAKLK
jgi:DUF177 domain-containing protein